MKRIKDVSEFQSGKYYLEYCNPVSKKGSMHKGMALFKMSWKEDQNLDESGEIEVRLDYIYRYNRMENFSLEFYTDGPNVDETYLIIDSTAVFIVFEITNNYYWELTDDEVLKEFSTTI